MRVQIPPRALYGGKIGGAGDWLLARSGLTTLGIKTSSFGLGDNP